MEEEVIILEILGKSGRVREHVRLSRFPATIGRAYDNDVILDDQIPPGVHQRSIRTPRTNARMGPACRLHIPPDVLYGSGEIFDRRCHLLHITRRSYGPGDLFGRFPGRRY